MTRRSSLFETVASGCVAAWIDPMVMGCSPPPREARAGCSAPERRPATLELEQLPLKVDLIARLPGVAIDVRVGELEVVLEPVEEPGEADRVAALVVEQRGVQVLGRVLRERLQLDTAEMDAALDQEGRALGQIRQEVLAVDLGVISLEDEAVAVPEGLLEEEVGTDIGVVLLGVDAPANREGTGLPERGAAVEEPDLGREHLEHQAPDVAEFVAGVRAAGALIDAGAVL